MLRRFTYVRVLGVRSQRACFLVGLPGEDAVEQLLLEHRGRLERVQRLQQLHLVLLRVAVVARVRLALLLDDAGVPSHEEVPLVAEQEALLGAQQAEQQDLHVELGANEAPDVEEGLLLLHDLLVQKSLSAAALQTVLDAAAEGVREEASTAQRAGEGG